MYDKPANRPENAETLYSSPTLTDTDAFSAATEAHHIFSFLTLTWS